MEISQYPNSISIKDFQKRIKRDIDLFIELIKTTLQFLDTIYKEAQKFFNMESKLKSTKISLTSNKPIITKKQEERKPYKDRHMNAPHFKSIEALRGKPDI